MTTTKWRFRLGHRANGFSLVEVAIAMAAVVVFALLTVVALIPTGLNRQNEIREQRRAVTLFESLDVAVRGQSVSAVTKHPPSESRRFATDHARGFSLVEIVLALGLVSFVLVAIIGLFSIGLTGTRASGETVNAANLATEILNKRLAAPTEVLPNLKGQAFGLPPIPDVSTLPTTKPALTEVIVGPGGYEADDGFRLGYAMWR